MGKDCIKKFCKYLRKHATKIINFKKRRNDSIGRRSQWIITWAKSLLYMQKEINADNEKYYKVRGQCHHTGKNREAHHDILNLR